MVKEILLNNIVIVVEKYTEELVNGGLHKINVEFKVTSEDYHDIATLLYEKKFDVKIPERDLSFHASIQEYSTSITNLYEKGQVADYKLSLVMENE